MTGEILLYGCPHLPGSPKIRAGQCGRNKWRAEKAAKVKRFTRGSAGDSLRSERSEALIFLEVCLDCPGVAKLEASGEIPKPVAYMGPMVRARPGPRRRRKRIGHNVWIRHQSKVLGIDLGEMGY